MKTVLLALTLLVGMLAEPPANAPMGPEVNGCAIGLWSEKTSYTQVELKNVWVILEAKYVPDDFYTRSHVVVRLGGKLVKDIRVDEPTDGIPHAGFDGGMSAELADLKPGTYSLVWTTATNISNRLTITITR